MSLLSPEEEQVADLLGEAFNLHQRLEVLHPHDREEFMRAIHAAQNIVMTRPVLREAREGQRALARRAADTAAVKMGPQGRMA